MSRLDPDAACALASEECESSVAQSVPIRLQPRERHGHEGLRRRIEEISEGWPSWHIDFTVEPRGDAFLVTGRYRAYHDEPAGHEAPFISLVTLDDDGKVLRIVSYGSEQELPQHG